MNSIANKIIETRKIKGLSQEELAEQSKISLRTLQRIENNENNPRGKTLSLICNTLDLNLEGLLSTNQSQPFKITTKFFDFFFLAVANLILVALLGFMTIDSQANFNSRFAMVLLSILIPLFIVNFTPNMSSTERLLKFGFGSLLYFIATLSIAGFVTGFLSGLFLCMLINLSMLYFGSQLIHKK
ncbi:helix-turn-helix domain-containing protein [Cellulophaga sp. Z1A5H]|uniref:helix-turn-helix domain-containing protein n=1 Tax=Cellulophaga sp. Z1A5H TaxID=2687291 RepID=UPI0013FE45FC|nr:helix-turn-helix transcriptional regulator [Cellulophaga sp. Z1A5H]